MDVADYHTSETLVSPPYAESSMARRSVSHEEMGEIEHQEAGTIPKDSPLLELKKGRIKNYVERAKRKCYLHKVHSGLRDASAKHYEPVLVSIGPYHHGKAPLQEIEKHKVHYSQVLLDRKMEENSARYIQELQYEGGKPQALDCYVDTFQMDLVSFGECMVLDGLFMIELFRRNMKHWKYIDFDSDMIFNIRWMKPHLARDMLLFENQIPLLVLRKLFEMTRETNEEEDLVGLVLGFFEFNGKWISYDLEQITLLDEIPHLLGLMYKALVHGKRENAWENDCVLETPVQQKPLKFTIWSVFKRLKEALLPKPPVQSTRDQWKSCEFIRTVVALEEVGVMFVKADDNTAFHGIDFRDGVLSIPRLVIDDNTECLFRNLVAYEQYTKQYSLHRVADYLRVMDCLINTSKYVELLRHCGVIDNRTGDDVTVSTMFNHLCCHVYFDQTKFFYAQMFHDVNEFCKNRRNVWMAKLKNKYFGTPWSVISFFAASLLLLLTAFQTGYTLASYYKQS